MTRKSGNSAARSRWSGRLPLFRRRLFRRLRCGGRRCGGRRRACDHALHLQALLGGDLHFNAPGPAARGGSWPVRHGCRRGDRCGRLLCFHPAGRAFGLIGRQGFLGQRDGRGLLRKGEGLVRVGRPGSLYRLVFPGGRAGRRGSFFLFPGSGGHRVQAVQRCCDELGHPALNTSRSWENLTSSLAGCTLTSTAPVLTRRSKSRPGNGRRSSGHGMPVPLLHSAVWSG